MKRILFLLFLIIFVSCDLFDAADDIFPELSIIHPLNNGIPLSIRDTIKVEASDSEGIKRVECEISDSTFSYLEIDEIYPFEIPVSFLDNHLQEITIECKVIDENNNESISEFIIVTINNDLNPINGRHDGDEKFIADLIELNQISELFMEETTWLHINNLDRISEIQYRNMNIDSIPISIQNLSQIKNLELSSDSIKILPELIGSLLLLEEIRVQNNLISDIPESIGKLKKLQIIDFSDNYIDSLPHSFYELSCDECQIEIIKLQNNNIDYIDLYNFNHLEVVWLANNQLEDIILPSNSPCLGIWGDYMVQENPSVTLEGNKLCKNGEPIVICSGNSTLPGPQNCD